ncbi:hypothetical protein [Actinophytocola sediminis]
MYKTAQESRISDTVLSDDDELSVPCRAGFIYTLRAVIFYSSGVDTGDLKYGWTAPADSSMWWGNFGLDIGSTTQSGSLNTHFNTDPDGNGNRQVGAVSEGPVEMSMDGLLTPGADGNLTFQWAQGTSSATATIVRETSHVILSPIRRF